MGSSFTRIIGYLTSNSGLGLSKTMGRHCLDCLLLIVLLCRIVFLSGLLSLRPPAWTVSAKVQIQSLVGQLKTVYRKRIVGVRYLHLFWVFSATSTTSTTYSNRTIELALARASYVELGPFLVCSLKEGAIRRSAQAAFEGTAIDSEGKA